MREITKEVALAAARAQAFWSEHKNCHIVHCRMSIFSADWLLADVEVAIQNALKVGWADSYSGHEFAVQTGHELEVQTVISSYFFGVTAPVPVLVFTYTNHRGETAERRITKPEIAFGETEHHKPAQWLITGWCLDRKATRTFGLLQMTNLRDGDTAKPVVPPSVVIAGHIGTVNM